MKTMRVCLAALACAGALAGCRSEGTELPPPRPVLSIVVQERNSTANAFAGTVEPRYRSPLGFRVLGRVIARDVNVGDHVVKGQRLAALDPVALDFAIKVMQAEFANATAQFNNAAGAENRNSILFKQNNISADQFEQIQQTRQSAEASVTRARTALDKVLEQRSYADLRAEFDGIVTSIDTEVGQTVSAGQSVVTIARPDIREAAIDVAEDISATLTEGTSFEVALQTAPTRRVIGKVREISPQIDPLTHTRRIKVTLDGASEDFRLGATITAYLLASGQGTMKVPGTAIWEREGKRFVWVVNPKTQSVESRQVQTGVSEGDSVIVSAGLQPGTRVVTAGVHSLAEGQLVKISQEVQE